MTEREESGEGRSGREKKKTREPREARKSRPETRVRRGPTSDVGGPPGIERGVGLETGEETP